MNFSPSLLLGQSGTSSTTSNLEFDWPYLWWEWLPFFLIGMAVIATLLFVRKDTSRLPWFWKTLLGGFRLSFLAIAIVIALNPHVRTQTSAFRSSRVILLVDTSTSMQQPAGNDPGTSAAPSTTRAEVVRTLLEDSPLIDELRSDHIVDVYTFQDNVSELLVRLPQRSEGDGTASQQATASAPISDSSSESDVDFDWSAVLAPEGHLTRLGDAVDQLLVEAGGATLSGIVVVSDGAVNAGKEVSIPRERAIAEQVRLVTVGVGGTEEPRNLEVVRVIAPTDVQKGDSFEFSAILNGQGVTGDSVQVELLQQGPNDPEPIVVLTENTTMSTDAAPTEIRFDLKPSEAGEYEFTLRAKLQDGQEIRDEDNQLSRTVSLYDRPLRVLVVAGGPMRDYRFSKNVLHRHPSILVDVWLQTGTVGISQESNRLLFRFPEDKESMYEYDVVLAFDPDWSQLSDEQQELLNEWVSNEGGGVLVVAGDVYTSELAASEELSQIKKLYPVLLEEVSLRLGNTDVATTPFPVGFTQEGQVAEFLKVDEDGESDAWEEFPGVYRTYPTVGAKAGATVFAEFTDPLARGPGGQPILIASQRFGQGNVLYLGSPEMWRLRAIEESYFERFWIKAVRKAAEGRSKRGLQRSFFILDGREFDLGQSVPLRVRSLTPEFEPLVADSISLDLYGPRNQPILPGPTLTKDRVRPSEFVGDYRPLQPGRYRFEYDVPDSNERITQEIDVLFPRQEAASFVQEVGILKQLVEGTGGDYFPIEQAAEEVALRLPNRSESVTIDQKIQEVWDRKWLMVLLAALLSAEWLTRKLLRLA
ncbi:hypothetical protein AB1L42_20410 [Thalassoglobus sp. JC818]|uniref:hypothetical protein n=1 Tax=Thalassoglobus sp. JC818 TaxID=3232136 RepID=UPI0034578CC4